MGVNTVEIQDETIRLHPYIPAETWAAVAAVLDPDNTEGDSSDRVLVGALSDFGGHLGADAAGNLTIQFDYFAETSADDFRSLADDIASLVADGQYIDLYADGDERRIRFHSGKAVHDEPAEMWPGDDTAAEAAAALAEAITAGAVAKDSRLARAVVDLLAAAGQEETLRASGLAS